MSRMLNEASFWNMSLVSAQCDQSICFKKLNREGLDQSEHTCGLALVFKMRTWIKVFFSCVAVYQICFSQKFCQQHNLFKVFKGS